MSDAYHLLEEFKNRLLGGNGADHITAHEDHAWQIVVIDLAGSTLRVLKELEEPPYPVLSAT